MDIEGYGQKGGSCLITYPVWFISLWVFSGLFNLSISIMMFYFRLRGGSERYTKSQLWAMTLLAYLFLLNSVLMFALGIKYALNNSGDGYSGWWAHVIWATMSLFTSFLLLSFGLIYPRPIMSWKRLKWTVLGVLALGYLFIIFDLVNGFKSTSMILGMELRQFAYLFAIFIPVFIWLSQYSRQPSKESRMIYSILVWGFLFVVITQNIRGFIVSDRLNSPAYVRLTISLALCMIALIRLGYAMWGHRKIWSNAENLHIVMVISAVIIGIFCGQVGTSVTTYSGIFFFTDFLAMSFGWVIIRPLLFSYGLLRYRLLGSQVKAEASVNVIIVWITVLLLAVILFNFFYSFGVLMALLAAVVFGAASVYPVWRLSKIVVQRLLPPAEDITEMSMKERRNIYMMGLQAGVVKGKIDDERDRLALQTLKEDLEITDREHDLLMESIALHEVRLAPERLVEEAYLIHKFGLLVGHYRPEAKENDEDASDTDIFAGMLTAITEYVGDAMKTSEDSSGSMDTVSYGQSSLVMEKEGAVVLAALISGTDDLELRQLMRDTLAELTEKHPEITTDEWDGNLHGLEDVEKILKRFARQIKNQT